MSLLHRAYSGFFPFDPANYAREVVAQDGNGCLQASPLYNLTKIFWLSQSAIVTFSLNYSMNFGGGTTDVGTCTGTQAYAGPAMLLPPAQRTDTTLGMPTDSDGWVNSQILTPFYFPATNAGTFTTSSGSNPYSGVISQFQVWYFRPMLTGNCIAFDLPTKLYYASLLIEGGIGANAASGPTISTDVNGAPPLTSTSGIVQLQINGANIVSPSSINLNYPDLSPTGSITLTGTIAINFNAFGTP